MAIKIKNPGTQLVMSISTGINYNKTITIPCATDYR